MFSTKQFWQHAEEQIGFDMSQMFGVYIFARRSQDGKLTPVYIGKTSKSFGSRLRSHFRNSRIVGASKDMLENESLYILFVAVTTTKRSHAAKLTESRKGWVDFLETTLIAFSKVLNPELQNDKKTLLDQERVCVPGFLGDDPSRRDDAAQTLAAMLKPALLRSIG